MEAKIIGQRIKKLMEIKKIPKKQLSEALQITEIELEDKLIGKEEFYLSQIMQIKEIFQLNLDIFACIFFEEDFNLEEALLNL